MRRSASIGIAPTRSRPMPEQLGRAHDRLVHVGRGVERARPPREAGVARARQGALARGRQRGHVRDRAAARERARSRPGSRRPGRATRASGARPGRRRRATTARLTSWQAASASPSTPISRPDDADEREEARPRLRDRAVEHERGLVERLQHAASARARSARRAAARSASSTAGCSGRAWSKLSQAARSARSRARAPRRAARRAAARVPVPPCRPWCHHQSA